MTERAKKILGNNYFLSFIAGALAYYLFLSYSQVAGGKYVLLEGDALDSICVIKMFVDNILNGKGIAYTWSLYLGINSYVLLPGFNITLPLYFIFHNFDYSMITVWALVIKAGLASLFFYLYVDKIWNNTGIRGIVFSVFYAVCAFQVSYTPILYSFSDAIFMLPLILYFVSIFANTGKYKLMCVAYLYLFVSFFYPAYIIGFFSLFYLIIYMIFVNKYTLGTIIKKLIFFGICILITSGLTGINLYPIAYFLMTKYAEDATTISKLHIIYPHDLYNQFFIGQNCKIDTAYPYIYCGLPALILSPFYFVNKKINNIHKKIFMPLLILMLVSNFVLPLYLFWHLFDAPDSFPFRYSFIISFLFCIIACEQSRYLFDIRKLYLFISVIINSLIYIMCMFVQPLLQKELVSYPHNTWKYFVINMCFLLIYYMWFWGLKKFYKNEDYKKAFLLLIIMISVVEVIINGRSTYYKDNSLLPANNYDTYKLWNDTTNEALSIIRNDKDGFYRINCRNDYTAEGPMYFNYNGISSFSNIENYKVRKAAEALGLATSPRNLSDRGLTDFTRMLLGVRYEIDSVYYGNHRQYIIDYDQHANIIKNDKTLSLGFLVNDDIENFSFSGTNQFKNINELASSMLGQELEIYDLVSYENMTYDEVGVKMAEKEDGNLVFKFDPIPGTDTGIFFLNIPLDDREAYVQFDYGSSAMDIRAPYIIDGVTGTINDYERLAISFIKPMSRLEEVYSVGIYMTKFTYDTVYLPKEVYFAYYNKDQFEKVYDELKTGQMEVKDYGNEYVKAHIDVNEDGKILFTSIPYDEGWEIKVNGETIEPIGLLDDAFLGIKLNKGSYDIDFSYHVPGLKTGAIITGVSLLLFIILFCANPKVAIKRKINKEDGINA